VHLDLQKIMLMNSDVAKGRKLNFKHCTQLPINEVLIRVKAQIKKWLVYR
jgi:hypothetical protein